MNVAFIRTKCKLTIMNLFSSLKTPKDATMTHSSNTVRFKKNHWNGIAERNTNKGEEINGNSLIGTGVSIEPTFSAAGRVLLSLGILSDPAEHLNEWAA